MRDRFDEFDDPLMEDQAREPVCGDCDEWTRCTVRGHESVGWCSRWGEFFEEGDEQCA